MAVRTYTDLIAEINTLLPSTGQQHISGQDLRSLR